MTEGGFFEQKRSRPGGLAFVIGMHAAVLSALVLVKGPVFEREAPTRTEVTLVPLPVDPPPVPPPPPADNAQPLPPRSPTSIDLPPRAFPTPSDTPATDPTRFPPMPPTRTPPGDEIVAEPRVAPPVRRDAELDPRYADALQPPYPASEERAGREGSIRVRVTIGTNGRVNSVERLSGTNDAFWRVTERQALSRWRFRPATIDGRPVEATKVMTVHFELTG